MSWHSGHGPLSAISGSRLMISTFRPISRGRTEAAPSDRCSAAKHDGQGEFENVDPTTATRSPDDGTTLVDLARVGPFSFVPAAHALAASDTLPKETACRGADA